MDHKADALPFARASAAYLEALLDALPAFMVRLGNELAREGECELTWLDALEEHVANELTALLGAPVEEQAEPPIGLVRRLVLESVRAHVERPNVERLERRGLLPRSAVDISPDLAAIQVQWGRAKAESLGVVSKDARLS
ncbi:hypothetical protein Afer_1839 [Acidimicrobium ferrooxidans DSM 10331]|uniref:Uncharacterized protein n=1 Tax=Acidimicrobium ferrooxidans (strain DSM 10331 / JCM 15462 / NBRC 103882 / ICP) TaxID=525909 RepID=C7M1A5_ACIFD|nr:hypothetical protein [Acidimicrobium ferrooxidans]ACU54753.1 hypothetical protein Afer_1839 [Acidimicrobium ferrooxidans DSM 10331]